MSLVPKNRIASRLMTGSLAAAALFSLAACNEDGHLPRNSRHWVALSPEIQSKMSEVGVSSHAPMLIRAFKKEGELEVWKADSQGEYKLVKTFPVCRWSGQLGPKKVEGDRQVPEGFYAITPNLMNPNSSFFLSFNIGYPNQFDRSLGRNGSHIMVHGACSSRGCFAMTDSQIRDIYALARESFNGGQKAIQMQSFPFRFTPENLARYRADDNIPFWKNLKEGSDHFEVTRREPQVAVCGRRYLFNAQPAEGGGFDANASCPPVQRDEQLVASVQRKAAADEQKVASLVSAGTKAIKRIYADGDQHVSFKNTVYASVGNTDGAVRTASAQQSASRVPEVSRPEELAFGAVEVPAEQARGLNRQQLLAKAENTRQQQMAALAAPAPAAPAAAPVAAPQAPARAGAQPASQPQSGSAFGGTATSVTALAATPPTPAQPAFYQRWLGSLGGLTASATETEGQTVDAPLPPIAPRR